MESSSYITNLDAQIVQHVEYVPFGEVFIEERNQSWNTPYLFNGKELDEETGLYYYGARYYNPRESIFLSVDQMLELTMTPYQYSYQNPINYIDPTGMLPGDPEVGETRTNSSGKTEVYDDGKWHTTVDPVIVEGKRSTSKVGIRHSYWNGYTANQGAASSRLHQAIMSNPATNDIDHQLLDAAGLVPVFGEVFDGINAGMYAYEGDYVNAAFSAGAMLPIIGWGVTGLKYTGKLVKITAIDKDVMMFTAKIGKETVEGVSNFTLKEGKLFLNQLHLDGSKAGAIGRKSMWDMAKDLGRQFGVDEVIIQGGRRSTGKYKGKVPSPITIKIE